MGLNKFIQKVCSYLIVIALWHGASRLGLINTLILPGPLTVFKTMYQLTINGSIWVDIFTSLIRVSVGFIIAALFGIFLGYLIAVNRIINAYLNPIIEILRPIPPIAFIPIAILWFGIGNGPAYFIVSFGAFFPIFTSTFYGIISVNPIHINAGLCLGAKKKQLLFDVIFPAAMPHISSGLKSGIGVAWFCVIAAELVGAQSGLGYMIQLNRLTLQSDKVIAGMIVIGIIGYFMSKVTGAILNKFIPWSSKPV